MTSHQQRERGRARPAQTAPRRDGARPRRPAQPTCACASCYCVFKTEKTVVGYFIAKYAKMPFLTSDGQKLTKKLATNSLIFLSYTNSLTIKN